MPGSYLHIYAVPQWSCPPNILWSINRPRVQLNRGLVGAARLVECFSNGSTCVRRGRPRRETEVCSYERRDIERSESISMEARRGLLDWVDHITSSSVRERSLALNTPLSSRRRGARENNLCFLTIAEGKFHFENNFRGRDSSADLACTFQTYACSSICLVLSAQAQTACIVFAQCDQVPQRLLAVRCG
jgi:hypothetical protein